MSDQAFNVQSFVQHKLDNNARQYLANKSQLNLSSESISQRVEHPYLSQHGKLSQKISEEIKKIILNERRILQQKNKEEARKTHECQKCDCSGTTECGKKISYLEGKVREYLGSPYQKQVNQIYDIQRLGLNNQNYLVEYIDNSLQKLNVKYIKKNYLINYVNFLERQCFKQF